MPYGKDDPFTDPLVRCDSCGAMVRHVLLSKLGGCEKCGNRRVKNMLVMTPEELAQARKWNIDPEFLALFEEVDEDALAAQGAAADG